MPGHPARHQSVPDHVGRGKPARGDCGRFFQAVRRRRESHPGDRLLRLDRGDALHASRRARSWRRSRHLRAVLRKLRPRQHHLGRGSSFRAAARTGLDVRRAGARRRVQRQDARHHHQHAEQPDGEGVHQGRAAGDCQAMPEVGRAGDYRRDLRAHHLRRTHACAHRVDRRHGRSVP